jgi:hypothetical protein
MYDALWTGLLFHVISVAPNFMDFATFQLISNVQRFIALFFGRNSD